MAGGAGEGNVEQVEVVDDVLQVLVLVVGLVDGARHALLAIVDGDEGKGVEGLGRRTAPQDVAALLLQLPVAEGTDDVVELQALGLVDADEADAAELVALDGLGGDGGFPLLEEAFDIGGVVGGEVGQLVVERTDIGALAVEAIETEKGEETLHQFVERQFEQRRGVVEKERRVAAVLLEEGACQLVVGVGE